MKIKNMQGQRKVMSIQSFVVASNEVCENTCVGTAAGCFWLGCSEFVCKGKLPTRPAANASGVHVSSKGESVCFLESLRNTVQLVYCKSSFFGKSRMLQTLPDALCSAAVSRKFSETAGSLTPDDKFCASPLSQFGVGSVKMMSGAAVSLLC